jgi:hypothetical protein
MWETAANHSVIVEQFQNCREDGDDIHKYGLLIDLSKNEFVRVDNFNNALHYDLPDTSFHHNSTH